MGSTPQEGGNKFRIRLEQKTNGTEVDFSDRSIRKALQRVEKTIWQARVSGPEVEAECLACFMIALGATGDVARDPIKQIVKRHSLPSSMAS